MCTFLSEVFMVALQHILKYLFILRNKEVALLFHQHLLVADHDAGGLLGLCAAANMQVYVRKRNSKFLEKAAGHVLVIVLTSMDQAVVKGGIAIQGLDYRGYLHEVGPRPGDEIDKLTHGLLWFLLLTTPGSRQMSRESR